MKEHPTDSLLAPKDDRPLLSILVADDHNLVRSVLCAYLRTHTWGTIASAGTLEAALRIAREQHFDILLLDLHMPGVNGESTIRTLASTLSETQVVVWSASVGSDIALKCIEAGARGFLPKDMRLELLLPALNIVKLGEIFLPSKYVILRPQPEASEAKEKCQISETDLAVLKLIENGAQNKAIALQIGKNETNVKALTRKIFMRIGAKNRAHAVHIAKMNGWL